MEDSENKFSKQGGLGYVHHYKDIPVNAIPIPSFEIIKMQDKIIDKWTPAKEMFLMKHGHLVLGSMTSLTGFAYVTHLRRMLLLRSKLRFATYGPSMILPFFITSALQSTLITRDLSLRITSCPVCLETRSAAIQLISGVFQPFCLAVLSTTAAAKLSSTYPLPPITDYKNAFKIYARVCRPLIYPTVCLTLMNVACSVMTTFSQFHAVQKVHKKLVEDDIFMS